MDLLPFTTPSQHFFIFLIWQQLKRGRGSGAPEWGSLKACLLGPNICRANRFACYEIITYA